MSDSLSKEKRSEVMSKIKNKDTKIEIQVRHWLYNQDIRYRKNCKSIVGNPDIAIRKYKIAIFVHGCFWHGHENCRNFRMPKSNIAYWENKIKKNIDRDLYNIEHLKKNGWNVFVIWDCQLKKDFNKTMSELLLEINFIKSKYKQFNLPN